MTSSHISTSAATSRGASERPDAISIDAFRALSPESRAARIAAITEADKHDSDERPLPAILIDAWRAMSPDAKATRAAEFDAWEKRQTADER